MEEWRLGEGLIDPSLADNTLVSGTFVSPSLTSMCLAISVLAGSSLIDYFLGDRSLVENPMDNTLLVNDDMTGGGQEWIISDNSLPPSQRKGSFGFVYRGCSRIY